MNGMNEKKWVGRRKMSNKKRSSLIALAIFLYFFGNFIPYNKNDLHQIEFEEDLRFFIVKEHFPLSSMEETFFKEISIETKSSPQFSIEDQSGI